MAASAHLSNHDQGLATERSGRGNSGLATLGQGVGWSSLSKPVGDSSWNALVLCNRGKKSAGTEKGLMSPTIPPPRERLHHPSCLMLP